MQIPQRGFSAAEFEKRAARAQKIMDRHGFDALLLTAPPNVRYFTGFDSQFWESPTRPWFVVVPREGAPIAVIPEIGAPEMALTWVKDIRTWAAPNPEDDGLSLLKSTIESLPRKHGKVGAEMGREMALRMPVAEFLQLRGSLGLSLENGSPCIWEIRMIERLEVPIEMIGAEEQRIFADLLRRPPGGTTAEGGDAVIGHVFRSWIRVDRAHPPPRAVSPGHRGR